MAGWMKQYCRPNSNITSVWSANAYTLIADAVINPAAGDGVAIVANSSDDNETQSYGFSVAIAPMTIDSTDLNVYSKKAGAAPIVAALKYVNGSYVDGFNIPNGTTYAWGNVLDAASILPGGLTSLQVDFLSQTLASGDSNSIDVAYISVSGYPLSVQIVEWLLWLGLGLETIKPVLNHLAIFAGSLKDPKLMAQYAKWALQKQYRCVGRKFGNIINDSLREGYVERVI
jgi:hypothetical protein